MLFSPYHMRSITHNTPSSPQLYAKLIVSYQPWALLLSVCGAIGGCACLLSRSFHPWGPNTSYFTSASCSHDTQKPHAAQRFFHALIHHDPLKPLPLCSPPLPRPSDLANYRAMANVQVVRTRQAHATTIINETQSIQLVQTMLHGALSSLTYLRDLFPEKAFEYRYYEMRETPLPYKDFAAARMPSFKNQADPHSTKVPVLVRDRSNRANFFLDWLVSASAVSDRGLLTQRRRKQSSLSLNLASYAQ